MKAKKKNLSYKSTSELCTVGSPPLVLSEDFTVTASSLIQTVCPHHYVYNQTTTLYSFCFLWHSVYLKSVVAVLLHSLLLGLC